MAKRSLKVARIGNSRGVRLPAETLERYGIGALLLMEERPDGILLKPQGRVAAKLGWAETAAAMTREREEWDAWRGADADGLGAIPWDTHRGARVAEAKAVYAAKPSPPRKHK